MRFTTIYLEKNKIEIFNSFFGKEIIKVNNKVVSSKSSFIGADHSFNITENGQVCNFKVFTGFGLNGAVIDLYKNDEPIIESPKGGGLGILIVVLAVLAIFLSLGYLARLY